LRVLELELQDLLELLELLELELVLETELDPRPFLALFGLLLLLLLLLLLFCAREGLFTNLKK